MKELVLFMSVSFTALNRIDAHSIFFLSEQISLCDIWESRNPEKQSALSRVRQLVCSREKIQIQLLCLQVRHFLWHRTDAQEVDSLNTEAFTQVGN